MIALSLSNCGGSQNTAALTPDSILISEDPPRGQPGSGEDAAKRLVFEADAASKELKRFAYRFLIMLLEHRHSAALALCSEANVAAQRALGIGDQQYLAEAIGLTEANLSRGGNAKPVAHKSDHSANLKQLKRVVVESVAPTARGFELLGELHLADGRRYRMSLLVARSGASFVVEPAVG